MSIAPDKNVTSASVLSIAPDKKLTSMSVLSIEPLKNVTSSSKLSIAAPSAAISLPSTKPSTNKSPDKLIFSVIYRLPFADTSPVTLKPDNSKLISIVPAESNVVAIIVSAIISPVTFKSPSIVPPIANCLATLPPPDDNSINLLIDIISFWNCCLISNLSELI